LFEAKQETSILRHESSPDISNRSLQHANHAFTQPVNDPALLLVRSSVDLKHARLAGLTLVECEMSCPNERSKIGDASGAPINPAMTYRIMIEV
jgi:hypothetical protein